MRYMDHRDKETWRLRWQEIVTREMERQRHVLSHTQGSNVGHTGTMQAFLQIIYTNTNTNTNTPSLAILQSHTGRAANHTRHTHILGFS